MRLMKFQAHGFDVIKAPLPGPLPVWRGEGEELHARRFQYDWALSAAHRRLPLLPQRRRGAGRGGNDFWKVGVHALLESPAG